MTETFQVAILILVAILVGAMLPILFQFRTTLKQIETFLQTSGKRFDVALNETAVTLSQIQDLTAQMQRSSASVADALESAQRTMRVVSAVGAAVGPAVAAAIHAVQTRESRPKTDNEAPAPPTVGSAGDVPT